MEYKLREAEESDLDEVQRIEEDSFPDPFSRWNFLYYYLNHPLTFLVAE
ncbi:MAG TPA: ribosomal-protein-alanine N-acetyltransferase, partial [Candidatus Omnitrophica bacterium]|nr:ribosomal-protein-alanine N-acetyltransferase [Candidatus Omnitrophota bacterium]